MENGKQAGLCIFWFQLVKRKMVPDTVFHVSYYELQQGKRIDGTFTSIDM